MQKQMFVEPVDPFDVFLTVWEKALGLPIENEKSWAKALGIPTGKDFKHQYIPALNLIDGESNYTVKLDIPGINPNEISVDYRDGILSITGERKLEKTESGSCYVQQEISYGKFKRSVAIDETDPDNIDAVYKDGVLVVTIPKIVTKSIVRKIPVSS